MLGCKKQFIIFKAHSMIQKQDLPLHTLHDDTNPLTQLLGFVENSSICAVVHYSQLFQTLVAHVHKLLQYPAN